MTLLSELQQFDGKQTQPLESLASRLSPESAADSVIALAEYSEQRVQVGATWVLKRWHDDGFQYDRGRLESLMRALKKAEHWEVQLHLLQILSSSELPGRGLTDLLRTLAPLLNSENKLVRAWSFTVIATIGEQHARHRVVAIEKLRLAQDDSAASVQARVRQLYKQHPWLR